MAPLRRLTEDPRPPVRVDFPDLAARILAELVIDVAGDEAELKAIVEENAEAFAWLGTEDPAAVDRLRDRYRTRRATLRRAEAGEEP